MDGTEPESEEAETRLRAVLARQDFSTEELVEAAAALLFGPDKGETMRVKIDAYRCDNCRATWSQAELKLIEDLHQRVDIGGVVPAGECPTCGALCYRVDQDAFQTAHQRRIEEFMKLAGQEVPEKATMPSAEIRKLRASLILEEALETIAALGCYVGLTPADGFEIRLGVNEPSMEGIIDGCCDLSVVTIGTLSALGLPDVPFLHLVDENNLAKFGPGGYRREDGKWVKPPGHKPPDIKGMLDALEGKEPNETTEER